MHSSHILTRTRITRFQPPLYRNAPPSGTSTENTRPLLATVLAGGSVSLQRHPKIENAPFSTPCYRDDRGVQHLSIQFYSTQHYYCTMCMNFTLLYMSSSSSVESLPASRSPKNALLLVVCISSQCACGWLSLSSRVRSCLPLTTFSATVVYRIVCSLSFCRLQYTTYYIKNDSC